MTFKRIMLIVLPLLGAVFVFMVLRWLYQDWEASFVATPAPPPDGASPVIPMGKEAMRIQNVAHEVSTNVNLVRKGSDGRIDMRFLAERVDHQQSDTADIQRPRIQFFTRTGEVLTLLADQARVATTGTITNLSNIESGLLWGNVILIHDRRTPDDATDDLYVDVDNLKFDGEMSELATDGPVILVGPDIMLTARKMRMAIDRTTRRVTTMTFLEDIRITLATGEQMSIGLTGPAQMPPAPGRGSAGPAPEKTAPPAAPVPALSRIGPPKAPSPAVAAEGLAPPAAQAESADLWRIDLAGNVDASQGDQRLRCDRLGLYNRPGRAAGQTAPVETPGLPRRRPDEPDAAARGPGATARAPGAAAPESSGGSATDAPRRREGAALARLLAPDAPPPLIVVADGPLVITPVSLEERARLGDLVYQVAATGSPAVIEDAQTHAEAAEVQYNLRTGSGSLVGKGSPVVLEQPKRLRLTGGRLDFDRVKAIAVVQGEGQLEAQVQAASLTGTGRTRRPARQGDAVASPAAGATPASAAPPAGPPAPAAPTAPAQGALSATAPPAEGPSMLQASWTRGMGLEFYPPAAGASSAAARRAAAPGPADGRPFTDVQDMMGEIRRATFHGHAVVKQQGGMLKGEELAIDFLRAEAGRGQAVERLVGRGDVFIKNEPPPEPPAAPAGPPPAAPAAAPGVPPSAPAGQDTTKAPSTPAIGDIACQDLDLQFSRDAATGETQPKRLRATGGVAINDPSGEIRAEELTVNFGPSTKGGVEPQFFEAFGKVFVNRDDLHAEGDHVRRDL
ncbi:MAG: hypothetical protein FJ288_19430, partial [Planctomycetes bacterium]|nr:hypothetical protein [Planctomycetota bacterium]